MIVDLLVAALLAVFSPVIALLPQDGLDLPAPTSIAGALAGIDSLVPILGVLRLGAVMLSALAVFLIVRTFVFLRYLLLP